MQVKTALHSASASCYKRRPAGGCIMWRENVSNRFSLNFRFACSERYEYQPVGLVVISSLSLSHIIPEMLWRIRRLQARMQGGALGVYAPPNK